MGTIEDWELTASDEESEHGEVAAEDAGNWCHLCMKVARPQLYCQQCDKHMCIKCGDKHSARKIFLGHQLVSLQLSSCARHDGQTTAFFCASCMTLLCVRCVQIGRCDDHAEHVKKVSELPGYMSQALADIKVRLYDTAHKPHVKTLTKRIQELTDEASNLDVHMELINSIVTTNADKLRAELAARLQELKESLREMQNIEDTCTELKGRAEIAENQDAGEQLSIVARLLSDLPASAKLPDELLVRTAVRFIPSHSMKIGRLELSADASMCSSDSGWISLESVSDLRYYVLDMTYTSHGHLAMLLYFTGQCCSSEGHPRLVLYDSRGSLVWDISQAGSSVRDPSAVVYWPGVSALAILDINKEREPNIVLVNENSLKRIRKIKLSGLTGKAYRLAISGERVVVLHQVLDEDSGLVKRVISSGIIQSVLQYITNSPKQHGWWLSVFDSDGFEIVSWTIPVEEDFVPYLSAGNGAILVTDEIGNILMYDTFGKLLRTQQVSGSLYGLTCVPGKEHIYSLLNGSLKGSRLVCHKMKDFICTDKLRWSDSITYGKKVYAITANKSHVVVAGDKCMSVHNISS